MLAITEAAGAHLAQLVEEAKADAPPGDELVVRLLCDKEGIGLKLDHVQEDDITFEHEAVKVLAVSPELAETLDGRTLDVETTEEGQSLAIF